MIGWVLNELFIEDLALNTSSAIDVLRGPEGRSPHLVSVPLVCKMGNVTWCLYGIKC